MMGCAGITWSFLFLPREVGSALARLSGEGRRECNERRGGGYPHPARLFALLTRATLPTRGRDKKNHICRSTSFILSSAMASDGFNPFGQALAQFMMVWQR